MREEYQLFVDEIFVNELLHVLVQKPAHIMISWLPKKCVEKFNQRSINVREFETMSSLLGFIEVGQPLLARVRLGCEINALVRLDLLSDHCEITH